MSIQKAVASIAGIALAVGIGIIGADKYHRWEEDKAVKAYHAVIDRCALEKNDMIAFLQTIAGDEEVYKWLLQKAVEGQYPQFPLEPENIEILKKAYEFMVFGEGNSAEFKSVALAETYIDLFCKKEAESKGKAVPDYAH